jgi:predicted amidophosphoribosyltransferase
MPQLPAGPPPGFPRCVGCPYVRSGPAGICGPCAGRAVDAIPGAACPVCSQRLDGDGTCPNRLCADPRRRISRIHAIAYQSGPLRTVINEYKYEGARHWALIFGRLVLGWLEANLAQEPPDLVVVNPTYTGEGGREFPHTEAVIDAAAREDVPRRWPFDVSSPRALVKGEATFDSASAIANAKRGAGQELRAVLSVPDPSRTAGRRILVYDDVCTTGNQLDAVAGCLIEDGGAAQVEALVLARAPWRGRA